MNVTDELQVFDYRVVEIEDMEIMAVLASSMGYPLDRDLIQVAMTKDAIECKVLVYTIITVPFDLASIKKGPTADTIVFTNKTRFKLVGVNDVDNKITLAELAGSHLSRVAEFIAVATSKVSSNGSSYSFKIPSLAKAIIICEDSKVF